MAVKRNQRFAIPQEIVFEAGAAIIGTPVPVMRFNERKKAYTNEQERDEETGLLKWKAKIWDFSEDVKGSDMGLDLIFLAPVQPVPTGKEIRPGLREVEFENLMVQPRASKAGDFAKLTYSYFATGIKGDTSGTVAPGDHSAAAPRDRKAVA
ncbi:MULTISPECIES: hypothetical protein [unclassified Nocardia]|uniref:hypothetical protein n=1 Tax=unclassified Nocardia TaxID=2637762 RepID=UPI001CE410AF|nr:MULTISPECIES: hypothetical protein [unclassified Nocardia]